MDGTAGQRDRAGGLPGHCPLLLGEPRPPQSVQRHRAPAACWLSPDLCAKPASTEKAQSLPSEKKSLHVTKQRNTSQRGDVLVPLPVCSALLVRLALPTRLLLSSL